MPSCLLNDKLRISKWLPDYNEFYVPFSYWTDFSLNIAGMTYVIMVNTAMFQTPMTPEENFKVKYNFEPHKISNSKLLKSKLRVIAVQIIPDVSTRMTSS